MKKSKIKNQKSKINNEMVINVLKKIIDPELGVNIVDLGLIYDVIIKDCDVKIKMTLTSMGCPMSHYFLESVSESVKKIKGVKKVSVDLVFEPVWTPERMSKKVKEKLGM